MALDPQTIAQLSQAITGLQNVVQDPARGQELTNALKRLTQEFGKKDKDKELTDTLKSLHDSVKAERADKDPSFCLEKFTHNKSDRYIWYRQLEQNADLKKTNPNAIFPMVVDDETHSWYQTLADKTNLRTKFSQEFGEEGDKLWDKKKSFQELSQGALTACEFVCLVMTKAHWVFSMKDQDNFTQAQKNEIMLVLMNGFNDRIKTLVLTRKAESLEDVIKA